MENIDINEADKKDLATVLKLCEQLPSDVPTGKAEWTRLYDEQLNFFTDNQVMAAKFKLAEMILRLNTRFGGTYDTPIVEEGGIYRASYLESVPVTMETWARIEPELAKKQIEFYLDGHREDGLLPNRYGLEGASYRSIGFGWFSRAAWRTNQLLPDQEFLTRCYPKLCKWINWLIENRNWSSGGVLETWSPADTGQDNSTRYGEQHLHLAAVDCVPDRGRTPLQAADVSCLVSSEMEVLSQIAGTLGKLEEARSWQKQSESLKETVMDMLYDHMKAVFFDIDRDGIQHMCLQDHIWRPIMACAIPKTIVLEMVQKHLLNPSEFWTECPFPSASLSDPDFSPDSTNYWGGPVQGLTLARWQHALDYYGLEKVKSELAHRFISSWRLWKNMPQQINPNTGQACGLFCGSTYSPMAVAVIETVVRNFGIDYNGQIIVNFAVPPGASWSVFEWKFRNSLWRSSCKKKEYILEKNEQVVLQSKKTGIFRIDSE
ncbi:MAG: hypothetical protein ABIG61_07105 [Planctomycetota bacterium]